MTTGTYDLPPGFSSRIKPAPHLVEKYLWEAKMRGGAEFKAKGSAAKRTATMLRKTIKELSGHAAARDIEALTRAAVVLDQQAEDFSTFARWADALQKASIEEMNRNEVLRAERFADERWGSDPKAHLVDRMLLDAFDQQKGMDAIHRFITERHPRFAHVQPDDFTLYGHSTRKIAGQDERLNTANEILGLAAKSALEMGWRNKPLALIGRDIFDEYVRNLR